MAVSLAQIDEKSKTFIETVVELEAPSEHISQAVENAKRSRQATH
jgi:hypothetical protein